MTTWQWLFLATVATTLLFTAADAADVMCAGTSHSCAIRVSDGVLICNTNAAASPPPFLSDPTRSDFHPVISVVCGDQYTCAMLQPNASQTAFPVPVSTIVCFGNGQDGSATPLQILPDAAISMEMAARQLIYIDGNNQINVQPWGTEPDDQPNFNIPDAVFDSTEHAQISCTVYFCCSLYLNQTIGCYGNGYPFNQICEFPSLDEPVIPSKQYSNCYRRTTDVNNTLADFWCWSSALNPHQEAEAGFASPRSWVRVTTTLGGVFALRSDGVMWAYGFDYGVRGLPPGRFLTASSTPQDQQICAITLQAQMQCWGQNPIQAPSGQFRAVSTAVAHACAAQICIGESCLITEWLKCFPSNIQDATQRQSILFPHRFISAVPDAEAKIVCGITEPMPLPSMVNASSSSLILRNQLLCYEDPFNFNRDNVPPPCLGIPSCPSVLGISSHHGFFCALFNYTEHIEWLVQHQQPIPPVIERNNLVCFGSVNGDYPTLHLMQPTGLFSQVSVQESTIDARPPFNIVPFGCVLQQDTSIPVCWSTNATYFDTIPQVPFLSISGGYMAACGILEADHSIACFGPRAYKLTVPTGAFSQLICSADSQSCVALRFNGTVECFSYLPDFCPFIIPVPRQGFNITQLALGEFHLCLLYNDGVLQCKSLPELSTSVVLPQAYPPQGIFFQSVSAQEDATCGVEIGTQHVWCFGSLGLGSIMLLNTTVPQFQYARNPLNHSYCQSGTWSGWSGSPTSLCSGFCTAGRFSQSPQESSAICSGEAQPGYYSTEGSSSQTECPRHTFSATAGSSSCSSCFSQVYNDRSSCGIKNCSAGYSSSDDDCIPCPIGHVSPGSVASCIVCPGESFTPVTSAADSCVLCTGIVGVTCSAGLVNVTQGFYAWLTNDPSGATVRTIRCPSDRCSGNVASSLNTTELLVPPCSANRVLSASNYLCRDCIEGTREWNGDCVPDCDEVKWGLVVLLLFVCTLYCYLLHVLAQRETGLTSVLMFFAQTVFLQLGSLAEWLQYLGIFSLAPHQLTGKTCLAPLTSFQLLAVDAIIPLVFFGLLLLIVFLQIMLKTFKSVMRGSRESLDAELDGHNDLSLNESYASTTQVSGGCCAHFAASARGYTWSAFGRTTLNLFLFGYLQVSVTCFRYLQCVDVGGDDKKLNLLYTQPNIDCSSSEYNSYKPLVIILLVFVVILAPITLLAYGIIHRAAIKEYLSSVSKRGVDDSDVQLPTRSTSATIFGVLTDGYRAEAWWWSLALLLSRTSYASFSILLALDPTSKYLSFHLLNLALLCAANLVRPFEGEAIPSIKRWIDTRNNNAASEANVNKADLHFPVAACSNATLQLTTLSLLIISSLQMAYSISGSNALATGGTPSLWLQLIVSFFVIVPILLCGALIARGLYDTRVRPLLRRSPRNPVSSKRGNDEFPSSSSSSNFSSSSSFNADSHPHQSVAHPATAPSSSITLQSLPKQGHLSSSLREPLLEMKQL